MSVGRPKLDCKDDIRAIFDNLEREHEPLTAVEIASEIGCSDPTARKRLTELSDDGELETKYTSQFHRVWWK